MKNLYKLLSFAAIAAMTVSCSNNEAEPTPAQTEFNRTDVEFFAEALLKDDATKVALEPNADESLFSGSWEADKDAIGLYTFYPDAAQTSDYSRLEDNDNARFVYNGTSFAGTLASMPDVTGWKYAAYYPQAVANDQVPFGNARTQNGNTYNGAYDLMTSSVGTTNPAMGLDDTGKPVKFDMVRATAILYFHLTTNAEWARTEKVTKVILSSTNGKCITSLNFAKFSNSPDKLSYEISNANRSCDITLTFDEGTAPYASELKAYFNVISRYMGSGAKLSLTVYTDNHKLTLANNKQTAYNAGFLYKVSTEVPESKWESTLPTVIDAPTLNIASLTENSATLTWNLPSNETQHADHYEYRYCLATENIENAAVATVAEAGTLELTGLTTDATYTVQVRAISADGEAYNSAWGEIFITPKASTGEPVTYIWDFDAFYTADLSLTENQTYTNNGRTLTFVPKPGSSAVSKGGINGENGQYVVKMGGKSTFKDGMLTERYFTFKANKTGKLTFIHISGNKNATDRYSVVQAGTTIVGKYNAKANTAGENLVTVTIPITEPTDIYIYCEVGSVNYSYFSWEE